MNESLLDSLVDICAMLGALPDGMFQATIATTIHAWAITHNEDEVKVAHEIAMGMDATSKAIQRLDKDGLNV